MNDGIVVVDDLEMAADLMKKYLERSGISPVYSFTCPVRALHAMEQELRPVCVVTDYRMPGLNGVQLLEAASRFNPLLKGIVVTGDPDARKHVPDIYSVIEKGDVHFLKMLLDELISSRISRLKEQEDFSFQPGKFSRNLSNRSGVLSKK